VNKLDNLFLKIGLKSINIKAINTYLNLKIDKYCLEN